jgi:sarcosine oxidase subunit gamma
MAEAFAHRTPLAARPAARDTSVRIEEVTDRGVIDLRGHLADAGFRKAAKQVLGVDLPAQPRTSVVAGKLTILWLSLDQWLITCPREEASALAAAMQRELEGVHALAVDVSDMRAIVRVSGEGAAETLMKGTSVDLTLADGAPGTVRRLRFTEIAAMAHALPGGEGFDLYVFRSYAPYALQYLEAAARPAAAIRLFTPKA